MWYSQPMLESDTELAWQGPDLWASAEQRTRVEAIWAEPKLGRLSSSLQELGLEPLLVGGIVRDALLGRASKDVDLVVNCAPTRLLSIGRSLARLTQSTQVPLDPIRGTLRLCFAGGDEIDLVSLQGETLMDDLSRRDLRLNAMAIDSQARLLDPFEGREDIRQGRLQMICAENFEEDPLRTLRCLRLAAQLGFSIEKATLEAAKSSVPRLKQVAGERMGSELEAFFAQARPLHINLLADFALRDELLGAGSSGESLALLAECAGHSGLTLGQGLAMFLGPLPPPEGQIVELIQRLKLSRKTSRYLSSWWRGAEFLSELTSAELPEIYTLSELAGPAFLQLAQAALSPHFPSELSLQSRKRIFAEAQGEGEMNWESFPWSGHEIAELAGREPGAWLGRVIAQLELAWACGEISEDEELLKFLLASL